LEDGEGVLADFDFDFVAIDGFESIDEGDAEGSSRYNSEGVSEDSINDSDEVFRQVAGRRGESDILEEGLVALLFLGGGCDLLESLSNLW